MFLTPVTLVDVLRSEEPPPYNSLCNGRRSVRPPGGPVHRRSGGRPLTLPYGHAEAPRSAVPPQGGGRGGLPSSLSPRVSPPTWPRRAGAGRCVDGAGSSLKPPPDACSGSVRGPSSPFSAIPRGFSHLFRNRHHLRIDFLHFKRKLNGWCFQLHPGLGDKRHRCPSGSRVTPRRHVPQGHGDHVELHNPVPAPRPVSRPL